MDTVHANPRLTPRNDDRDGLAGSRTKYGEVSSILYLIYSRGLAFDATSLPHLSFMESDSVASPLKPDNVLVGGIQICDLFQQRFSGTSPAYIPM